jgi:hypothetical protein
MVRSALTVTEKAEDLAGIPGGCVAAVDQSDAGTHDGGAADARGGDRRVPTAGAAPVRTMAGAGGAGRDLPRDRGGAFRSAGRRAHQARRIDRVSIRDRQERGSPPLSRVPGGAGSPEQGPPSQSCETRRLSAVAAGGRSQARVPLVAPADRRLADESGSRRSGAAGGARDDRPVVVCPAAGRAAEGADPLPPIAPDGPSAARGTSGQWPGPTAQRGQQQRPSRRGGRSRRARAPGRRPPAQTRQQRDRDARLYARVASPSACDSRTAEARSQGSRRWPNAS